MCGHICSRTEEAHSGALQKCVEVVSEMRVENEIMDYKIEDRIMPLSCLIKLPKFNFLKLFLFQDQQNYRLNSLPK